LGKNVGKKNKVMKPNISPEFPFTSKYVEVFDSKIHYIDVSENRKTETVFLFIHGNPTSSYLWRNIIPYTTPLGRSIAMDLVGFGKSGKPNIDYTFQEHINYLNAFIKKLNIKNIVLVLHDWGGAIGFNYAMNNAENVKGIIFMETFCKPMQWRNLDLITRWVFKKFRSSTIGQKWNGKHNVFLRFILPMSIIRKLTKAEKRIYFEPFRTIESRKPIVKFPQEVPFKGEGTLNEKIVSSYYEWLKTTTIPKLLIYAKPGVQITSKEVTKYKKEFANITATNVGYGKHYIQEDQPDNIGEAIEQWYLKKY